MTNERDKVQFHPPERLSARVTLTEFFEAFFFQRRGASSDRAGSRESDF